MNPAATFGVVELRRYALHPGRRDALIRLFESAFIESQERCGMVPIGHYRDLDDPNSFVWFRGFVDMETRLGALEAFYTSRAWVDHRDAANATMIDSDNVLLLRSARPGSGFEIQGFSRPAGADLATGTGRFVSAAVLMLGESATEGLVAAGRLRARSVRGGGGARRIDSSQFTFGQREQMERLAFEVIPEPR
jgi:hypothetical protein